MMAVDAVGKHSVQVHLVIPVAWNFVEQECVPLAAAASGVPIADPAEAVATREVVVELPEELFATGQTEEAGALLEFGVEVLVVMDGSVSVCLDYHDRHDVVDRRTDGENFRSKLFACQCQAYEVGIM